MDPIESLGFLAGLLTTFAFLPQAIKTWRTGSDRRQAASLAWAAYTDLSAPLIEEILVVMGLGIGLVMPNLTTATRMRSSVGN